MCFALDLRNATYLARFLLAGACPPPPASAPGSAGTNPLRLRDATGAAPKSGGGADIFCMLRSLAQAKLRRASNWATNSSRQGWELNTMAVFTCRHALSEKFTEPSQHHSLPPLAASETIPLV